MNNCVSFNLQILPAENAFIPAVSSAALYGKGVFTTLAVYHGKPFLWEKHWHRLQENAARLGINLTGFDEKTVKDALSRLISENNLQTARARLTFFNESPGKIWDFETNNKVSLLVTTGDFLPIKNEFLLTVSPYRVNSKSPLAGVKSCNYAENLLAIEEARRRGFDEAVRLNEKGEIVSASTANIFWIKDEQVFTPALETGCLAGTTREFLLENFAVRETKSEINSLSEADEIFLTSAGIGIRAASFGKARKKTSATLTKMNKFLDLQRLKA
jgi:branched-subunit amino acid aminotransferase/4-amino-4-deoxychorismate lyase